MWSVKWKEFGVTDEEKEEKQWENEKVKTNYLFFDFALQSPAEHNVWHQKHLPTSWMFFLSLYTHNIQAARFILSFPVLFTPSLMCLHFSVPSRPVGNVDTAFMAVPICRTPHREGWDAASTHSKQTGKITILLWVFGAQLILFLTALLAISIDYIT